MPNDGEVRWDRLTAPALRDAVKDWFETDDDVPFMMQVFKIKPDKRQEIPAVTHVDGSGRLQTVTWAGNPRTGRPRASTSSNRTPSLP